MSHFAHVKGNVVVNVIRATQDFIDSGVVGDPSEWLECSMDHSIRGRYPGVGYWYMPDLDEFVPPKPETNPSFIWNGLPGQQGNWIAPIPHPGNAINHIEADWNEELCRWDIKERPIPYPDPTGVLDYYWDDNIQNWVLGPLQKSDMK
jgi:hypothetical protein